VADIKTDVGDDAENIVAGKENQQQASRIRNDPKQSMRSGDVYFNNQDNLQIWMKLIELASKLSDLTMQMDDLPNRVGRLERMEVVVRPGPEVVIRPIPPSTDPTLLTMRSLFTILIVAVIIIGGLIGFAVFWQVIHG
jgi:hypothetical protein